MTLSGADDEPVRAALEAGEPLAGRGGFAGAIDGTLVRDVLGRYPLFYERDEPSRWSHDRTDLDTPRRLPAGHVHDGDECREWITLPEFEPTGGVDSVRAAVDEAVGRVDDTDLAIAFSGGLDSAILAARLDAPLYTVGFPGSHDIEAARSAAALLDADLRVMELEPADLEDALPAVVDATGRTNAMDIEIALPIFVLARRVRGDGFDRLALGQGADELFGGYKKVAQASGDPRVSADTVRGARREMVETLPNQLERDVLALRAAGVEPVVPLLDNVVVEAALSLPGELLVNHRGERKWALRLAARRWLPDQVVFREKKAVQYGSLVARELDRLARQHGFKRRRDDHIRLYIESECL
ncbi:asparagine synthetase B family protein [Halobacteriaceae archaeon SHR40]|uniref:asparagine synthase C-terminal domain-containing protein n=1 Tax=Halovenus amylolytica TaxID=2500550 RepID=UPI000FE33F98